LGLLVAQFCRTYPGEFRNGEIEAPLFWMLCRQMRHILALDRVQMTNAVALGAGVVMNGDKLRPALDKDIKEAFPGG
jgi:hypothetical protein